jgi:hypothetical protein
MKQTTLLLVLIIATLLLTSCAHKFTIIPRNGNTAGVGVANEGTRSVTITLNGKTYVGKYVYGSMTNEGKVYVTAPDGDTIHCDFIYSSGLSGSNGIGTCEDNNGKKYDMDVE